MIEYKWVRVADLRGHAKSAVQPKSCSIHHSILDDSTDKLGEFLGSAQAVGEGDGFEELGDGALRKSLLCHWCVEEA